MWAPGPLLPWLTPTLVFPVIFKRKLKVRRREEPVQVLEPRSSWLQLWGEKGGKAVTRGSRRGGGEGAGSRGERRQTRPEGREGCSQQAEDPQRKGEEDRKTPSHPTSSDFQDAGTSFPGPSIYEQTSRLLPDRGRPPLPT